MGGAGAADDGGLGAGDGSGLLDRWSVHAKAQSPPRGRRRKFNAGCPRFAVAKRFQSVRPHSVFHPSFVAQNPGVDARDGHGYDAVIGLWREHEGNRIQSGSGRILRALLRRLPIVSVRKMSRLSRELTGHVVQDTELLCGSEFEELCRLRPVPGSEHVQEVQQSHRQGIRLHLPVRPGCMHPANPELRNPGPRRQHVRKQKTHNQTLKTPPAHATNKTHHGL